MVSPPPDSSSLVFQNNSPSWIQKFNSWFWIIGKLLKFPYYEIFLHVSGLVLGRAINYDQLMITLIIIILNSLQASKCLL